MTVVLPEAALQQLHCSNNGIKRPSLERIDPGWVDPPAARSRRIINY